MSSESLDDRLDRIVARYAERLAQGERRPPSDLLAEAPAGAREELGRCLRLMEAAHRSGAPAPAPIGAGSVLDGLRIERELGRGGMAVVYLATQLELNRPVALKVLRPGLALDERHVERFRREALAVARLSHPHIVQIYSVGTSHGHPYLAMEYVQGPTLAEVYSRLPPAGQRSAADLARAVGWNPSRVEGRSFEAALAELLAPAARALATAHEVGLVHRDIKPSNILIRQDGGAVIADFGLAKGDGDPSLSLSGEPLGTPYYMSPEQATMLESSVDRRTDVYSFGVVLYEGLAGRRPFEGRTLVEILDAVRHQMPPSVRVHDRRISANCQSLVRRAMERERDRRYPSALELAVDLNALSHGLATQAHVQGGGRLRRGIAVWRSISCGELSEYRSSASFLGLPLLHIRSGTGPRSRRGVAKGWIAFGPRAVGGIAMGGFASGVFALGGFSLGAFSLGGFTLGLFAMGGFSGGGVALGGMSAGHTAIGGAALGYYAVGGLAKGAHVLSDQRRDPQAEAYFREHPWLLRLLPSAEESKLLGSEPKD